MSSEKFAAIFAALIFLISLWMTARAYGPLPFWDAWHVASIEDSWGNLWALHNEHIIAIPRLFYGLDIKIAKGTGLLSIIFIWLFLSISCWLVARLSKGDLLPALTLSVPLMFWPRHLENLSWPFQVGFIGLVFISVFSIWALHHSNHKLQLAGLAASATAPLWSSQGFAVIIASIIFLVTVRKPKLAAVLAIALLFNLYLYISAGLTLGETQKSFSATSLLSAYLNIIIDPFIDLAAQKEAGWNNRVIWISIVAGLLFHAAVLLAFKRAVNGDNSNEIALICISLIGLGSSAMAALGRSEDYAGPGYRYAIFSVMAVLPIALIFFQRCKIRTLKTVILIILCAALLHESKRWHRFSIARGESMSSAIFLIKQNPDSLEGYRFIYPAPEHIIQKIKAHREHGLSINWPQQ